MPGGPAGPERPVRKRSRNPDCVGLSPVGSVEVVDRLSLWSGLYADGNARTLYGCELSLDDR